MERNGLEKNKEIILIIIKIKCYALKYYNNKKFKKYKITNEIIS